MSDKYPVGAVLPASYDRKAEFEAQVKPIIDQLIAKCEELGIPFTLVVTAARTLFETAEAIKCEEEVNVSQCLPILHGPSGMVTQFLVDKISDNPGSALNPAALKDIMGSVPLILHGVLQACINGETLRQP